MKIKQMVSIFLSVFLMVSLMIVPVSATGDGSGEVSPMYDLANTTDSRLTISETKATCISIATGTDIVKITAVQTLEKYWGLWIWNTVDNSEMTKIVYSGKLTLSNPIIGSFSGKYRVKTVFTFTDSSGKEEKVTVYSSEKSV